MSTIRNDLVYAAYYRAITLIDYNIYDNVDKRHKFKEKIILADKSLTKDEKSEVIKFLKEDHDYNKILFNEGKRRICENCQQKCLATLYCEYCIRNYLKSKFTNWTSGNNDIDDLIQNCQVKSLSPDRIIEWIPYNNLQNIKYQTKGGCSEIYTSNWINGNYNKWNSKEKQLNRFGTCEVILKKLENVESANRSWFDEAKSHLNIANKWVDSTVSCYGLTRDPLDDNYMLVMEKLDIDLREYLQQNHIQLTWKEKIQIIVNIVDALSKIHNENVIHRDLHSGNILYYQYINSWFISDFGFCGPADKPLDCIYGNLPYIAPEVIVGKEYAKASDIYSVAMLMWEISSGQRPFANYENEYNLAMDIVNGNRPKIVSGTPSKYKELMKQCWDADPTKRPDINAVWDKIREINNLYYQDTLNNNSVFKRFLRLFKKTNNNLNKLSDFEIMSYYYASSKLSTSKIYQFDNLPEPRNATEEELEAYHSRPYSFNIPDDIDDFNKSNHSTSNKSNIFKGNSKPLSKVFQKLRMESRDNNQNKYRGEIKKQQVNKQVNDEIYDSANFHSEEQDEFEIPDDGF
ncbi:kinase-like domain-containing protein [Rhizophagus clarus]|uniref:Kinase-like domain-containing protein n=1 Tax=Rhizophagus clarus TaxID=94130 RepID=A0A8H3LQ31_9GLOM|nr:kinase-like domain-containing protein [Rhizophagus clarus]